MTCSPIALFVYNRLWHTTQTVEALKKNKFAEESDLFIFSDGSRGDYDYAMVQEVRSYIKNISGFRSVNIIDREKNFGLANNIISGVTDIVNRYGEIIVLEDDMVTSPYFLSYMNTALQVYKESDKVISIHGYIYPVSDQLPETFFIRGADCWGWATWKRGWDLFESDGQKLLSQLIEKRLTKEFDFGGSFDYTRMLKEQISAKNNSWAIRWYASAFLNEKFTLYPGISLLKNIGHDGQGTHCQKTNIFDCDIAQKMIKVEQIPVSENPLARKAITKYFWKSKRHIISKVFGHIRKFLNKMKTSAYK